MNYRAFALSLLKPLSDTYFLESFECMQRKEMKIFQLWCIHKISVWGLREEYSQAQLSQHDRILNVGFVLSGLQNKRTPIGESS